MSARDIFERVGDARGLALNYNQVGQVFLYRGDWDQAWTMLEKGWEFAQRANYVPAQVHLLTSMAELALWRRDLSEAASCVERAERLADVAQLPEEVVIIRCLKATVLLQQGENGMAMALAEEALSIAGTLGEMSESYGLALRTLGEVALSHCQWDVVEVHLQRAIELFTTLDRLFDVGQCYLLMARLRQYQGDIKAAREWRHRAANIFHDLDVPLILQQIEPERDNGTT